MSINYNNIIDLNDNFLTYKGGETVVAFDDGNRDFPYKYHTRHKPYKIQE